MADENIIIQVTDKVSPQVAERLRNIADGARNSDSALKNLQGQLAAIKVGTGLQRLQNELARNSVLNQRLQTETQKTNVAMKAVETQAARTAAAEAKAAQEAAKLGTEQNKAATQAQRLATEQQRTAAAQQRAQAASTGAAAALQRLATEQQRTASAQSQATAASARAAAAHTGAASAQQRLIAAQQAAAQAIIRTAAEQTRANTVATQGATAQANLQTALQRTQTSYIQAGTASQRFNTEQQRTAVQTANAAAASDRAALAALRLAQAQQRAASATSQSASSLKSFLIQATAVAGLSFSTVGIIQLADAYTVMQNKLVNVTESQEQVNLLTQRLGEVANRTFSSVEATTTAFTRFDRSLKQMGKSQEETLRMTETINKALKVGGANAQESASALLQLSQGFNAGKLQGDEFRAVSENMPMVLDAVAKVLGIASNQVKKFASDGKISSEVLYKAFNLMQKEIDEKFGKTVVTVGDSVQVLKNQAMLMFGEFMKNSGAMSALSSTILALANNLDKVAFAAAVVGAALIAYFGPSLVTMLGAATTAVRTFTIAIATNPLGLLIVGITSAIAAITLFGDKIKVTSDGLVNLQDVAKAVWSFISDYAGVAADWIREVWNGAIDWVSDKTDGWGEKFRDVGAFIMQSLKAVINFYIGSWVGAFNVVTGVWSNFGPLMKGFFGAVVNAGAWAVETLVNSWQTGLRLIAKGASAVAPETAAGLNAALDSVSLKLPRVDTSEGVKAAKSVGNAFKQALSTDYVGGAIDAIGKRARDIAKKRKAEEDKEVALRGAGENTLAKEDEKAKKAAKNRKQAMTDAEKQANALAKVNRELDKELDRMFMLSPLREQQSKFDQIEEQVTQGKTKLNEAEAASIRSKIKAIQDATVVQKQFDRIYEEATQPLKEYEATQKAAQKLLDMGAITQERYNRELVKSKEAYETAVDPLRQFNRQIDEQVALLKVLPQQREVERQVMQLTNELLQQGIVLNAEELAQIRERLTLTKQLNDVGQAEASLMAESFGKRQAYIDQLKAIAALKANESSGFTSGDAASAVMSSNSDLDFSNTDTMFEANIAKYEDMYSRIDALRNNDLINEQTAATLRQRVWLQQQSETLNAADGFFGQMAQLQKSENSKMAAVGKAAAIAQAMVQTYTAATGAYAAMASIPYVGPALGVAAAAAAVAAGLANVQAIRSQSTGFMNGGYTGNMATNEVAGVVHGQEYVMTAAATNRIGVDNLQALQTGAASVQRNGDNVGSNQGAQPIVSAPNVNVPITAVVVSSKEQAYAALNSSEGKAIILETIEENGNTVARAIGAK